jgi:hypothetical protein
MYVLGANIPAKAAKNSETPSSCYAATPIFRKRAVSQLYY